MGPWSGTWRTGATAPTARWRAGAASTTVRLSAAPPGPAATTALCRTSRAAGASPTSTANHPGARWGRVRWGAGQSTRQPWTARASTAAVAPSKELPGQVKKCRHEPSPVPQATSLMWSMPSPWWAASKMWFMDRLSPAPSKSAAMGWVWVNVDIFCGGLPSELVTWAVLYHWRSAHQYTLCLIASCSRA